MRTQGGSGDVCAFNMRNTSHLSELKRICHLDAQDTN